MARNCTCEGDPCVCDEIEQMMDEVANSRVINQGFMVGPESFDIGPGISIREGEELVNIYFYAGEPDPKMERGQPSLTIGFDKRATAKLIYMALQAAKTHGWTPAEESDSDE